MTKFILALIALSSSVLIQVQGNERKCDHLGVLFYEELGCKPQGNKDGCPTSYKCEEYAMASNECNYQGRKFKLNEEIPGYMTDASCNVGCACRNHYLYKSGVTGVVCASLDCPEWLNPLMVKPGCYLSYSGHCCASGTICPPFDDVVCEVDGKTYKRGQKYSPKDQCLSCICDKSFSPGNYSEPNCKREQCGFETRHAEHLVGKCAPLYWYEGTTCCPTEFICDNGDNIIENSEASKNSEETCHFGSRTLKIGDYFIRKNHNLYGKTHDVKCACELPPYLTCKPHKN